MVAATLSRRGRPPVPQNLGDGKFAITIRGIQLKFEQTAKSFRLLTKNSNLGDEDIDYAREVLGKTVNA